MIYTEQQLLGKIRKMIDDFEDEVVEFKEARTNYSFKDIGKYFSALGNEANIRDTKELQGTGVNVSEQRQKNKTRF